MRSVGIDIGGANTKAVFFQDCEVEDYWLEHIPIWKGLEKLEVFLEDLEESTEPQVVAITMTGELSDVFNSKHEGVERLVRMVGEIFSNSPTYFLSLRGDFLPADEALSSPEELSASNWVSSALFLGIDYPNSLLIDVGSTTSDLIPIRDGNPDPQGWTDYGRLKTKELVYTGILRTPLSYLKSEVSLAGEKTGIAAECFANMADAYRVLGLIDESNYTCETPDGRGKSEEECMRRIARMFCSDLEKIGEDRAIEAAEVFQEEQVSMLREAVEEVAERHDLDKSDPILATGIGRRILAETAARRAGFEDIVDVAEAYDEIAALMTPAYGLGMLIGEEVL